MHPIRVLLNHHSRLINITRLYGLNKGVVMNAVWQSCFLLQGFGECVRDLWVNEDSV
jgi:hypothetical protein